MRVQCIKWITRYKIFNELIASYSQGLLTLNPVIEFFNSNYELSNYVYNGPYQVLLFSHKSTEHYWRNSLELCLIDQTTLLQSYLAYFFWLQKMSLSSSGLIFQLFFGSFSYYMSKIYTPYNWLIFELAFPKSISDYFGRNNVFCYLLLKERVLRIQFC